MSANRRVVAPVATVLAMLLGLVLVAAPSLAASPYPVGNSPTLAIANDDVPSGSTDTLVGANYAANEQVTLTLHSATYQLKKVETNASGDFTTSITLPAGVIGNHTITGTGATGDKASVKLIIFKSGLGVAGVSTGGSTTAGSSTSGAAGLSVTGVAIMSIGGLGLLLIVGGAILVIGGRRRRSIDA